jgi:RNA polymerase sigma-70 factor, ECF subfamily
VSVSPDARRALVDRGLAQRLFQKSGGARWGVPLERFTAALEASVTRAAAGKPPDRQSVERHVRALHLEDLALACACAAGHDEAWEHFIREHRPALYRAADALEPGGGARDLADSLYGELYGLSERAGERRSLFAYYHGRSSLATWLRAVLGQRYVDRVRAHRRLEQLPDDPTEAESGSTTPDPDRTRYVTLLGRALQDVVDRLPPRDRLRLCSYYADGLTLAQTGRLLNEHEATVSRQLARTRRTIREQVEARLRESGLTEPEISECFQAAAEDGGQFDLAVLFTSSAQLTEDPSAAAASQVVNRGRDVERKDSASGRSY